MSTICRVFAGPDHQNIPGSFLTQLHVYSHSLCEFPTRPRQDRTTYGHAYKAIGGPVEEAF